MTTVCEKTLWTRWSAKGASRRPVVMVKLLAMQAKKIDKYRESMLPAWPAMKRVFDRSIARVTFF